MKLLEVINNGNVIESNLVNCEFLLPCFNYKKVCISIDKLNSLSTLLCCHNNEKVVKIFQQNNKLK